MQRILPSITFAICLAMPLHAQGPKPPTDGVYQVHEQGDGPKVIRNDTGATLFLGQRLTDKLGAATLRSHSNDNTRFVLTLDGVGPYPDNVQPATGAIILNGR